MRTLEKFFFFALLFFLPFQTRLILFQEPQFAEWTSGFLYGTDLLALGVLFFWLLQKPAIRLSRADILLGVFVGASFIAILAGENRALAPYQALKLLEMAALFFYLEHNFRCYRWRQVAGVFIAAGVLQAFLAIGQFALQSDLGLRHIEAGPFGAQLYGVAKFSTDSARYIRAYGTFPHPNVLAVFLLGALFFVLPSVVGSLRSPLTLFGVGKSFRFSSVIARSLDRREGRRGNLEVRASATGLPRSSLRDSLAMTSSSGWIWATIFLLLFAFFLTFSRAVILIGSLGLFAYALWPVLARRTEILSRFSAANVFFILLLFYAVIGSVLWPELQHRFLLSRHEEAIEYRIASAKAALDVIRKHPLVGVGPGNFVWHIRQFVEDAPRLVPADGLQPVHNLFLLVASEIGLIGFGAFIAFFAFIAFQFCRGRPELRAPLVIFLVTAGTLAAVDHYFWTLQQGRLLWWLGWGIIAAYTKPS